MRTFSVLLLALLLTACGDDSSVDGPDGAAPSIDGAAPPGDGGAGNDGAGSADDAASACRPVEQRVDVMSALHVVGDIVYPDPPPAGGNHNQCWGMWGVHERELADERFVHNLEHGGVVFLYRCPEGCGPEVAALGEFVRGHDLAIVTPYASLPTRFGAVAWGHRLLSDCFDRSAFERFYADHRDRGLESISAQPPSDCR
jgi:hypothetical protein